MGRVLIAGLVLGGFALAAWTGAAAPKAAGQLDASKAKKGRSNMTTLDLRMSLKATKVITGESLPVEVTLENGGDSPVDVPDPLVASDLEYSVTSKKDPSAVQYLSRVRAKAERTMERPTSLGLPGKKLAPGAKEAYDEDLADYEVPVIGPGAYEMIAAYDGPAGHVESAGVAITIAPPHVVRMTSVAGATEERIAVLFAHQADGKQATLFQVETHPTRPGDGVAYPRKELAHASELRGLALAIELTENTGRRWWAWMDDHATGAGVGRGRFVSRLAAPVAHGLHGASLGPVGWQLSNDGALFVALGAGAGGHAALVVTAFSLSAPGVAQTIPVAGPAAPEAWAAQYRPADNDPQIELVTAARSGPAVKVTRQTIALGSDKASAPTTLIERSGPVATMAMAPLGHAGGAGGVVDILFGPDPKTGYLSFLRLPLAGGAASAGWDFSPPKNSDGKRPTTWAIPRTPLDPPMAATHVSDKIYVRRAGGDWAVVIEGVPHVEHLALESFGEGRVVAVWSDPAFGIRYQPVP